ncbi:hypothetical protein AWC17_15135 [Mycobacterium nebraskense]|jgi:hypothetical protein|uniref:PPE family domain-containing protein n=1 Tax=Mycobacterium nebraskense TaxID=244292 RepID=A0A1X1YYF2_9MYCO|nr:hypothetical protein [Mycobacterium nebraskense]MCV7116251.1 hypothetical protein [Mycobacterium nebraskense]ORW16074.1 hypothetical protein AWC17_15135 [Mycobacterium nebraskense]
MDLTVDPDGLRADASALQGSAAPAGMAPVAQAAAADTVSTHLAASLTTWAQSLHLLNDHAGQLRAAGGLALNGTATTLSSTDTENAAAISGILDGAATPGAPSPAAPGAVPDVALPTLPVPPTMTPPAPMPAEQIAALVHSGPGPGALRNFANHVREALGATVLHTAANVRNAGTSVAQNWRDGHQQAASNITDHADWLESSLHPQVLALAGAADAAAEHTDTLIQSTPHPQEFTDLNQRLKVAIAHYNATGGSNAAQVATLSGELTKKRATAMAAFQTFATAAPPTLTGAAQPPTPAPPIVQNPGASVEQLQPPAHTEQASKHDGRAVGHDHHGHGPGDPDNPDLADSGTAAPQPTPGLATPPAAAAAADPNTANTVANVAGMIMGAGTGAVGQVTHGLGGGSPLSALSSLSSLPGMGSMPHMGSPEMPESGGGPDNSSPDGPGAGDFGSGGTSPASGVGDGGAGGGGGAPMTSSSPAVGPPTGSSVGVGGPATGSAPPTGSASGGGFGMMPPMMGGMGGKNDAERKSEERRRVVMRPVANTEAVFGEVRREPRRRAEKDKK